MRWRVSVVLDYHIQSSDYKPQVLHVRDKSSVEGGGLEDRMRGRCSGWGWGREVTLERVELSVEYTTAVKANQTALFLGEPPSSFNSLSFITYLLKPIERSRDSCLIVQCLVHVLQPTLLPFYSFIYFCFLPVPFLQTMHTHAQLPSLTHPVSANLSSCCYRNSHAQWEPNEFSSWHF